MRILGRPTGEHRKQWTSQVLSNIKKKDKGAEETGERTHCGKTQQTGNCSSTDKQIRKLHQSN